MSFDLETYATEWKKEVSIPFEQGDVFRQEIKMKILKYFKSQSLSSRAMSFDLRPLLK